MLDRSSIAANNSCFYYALFVIVSHIVRYNNLSGLQIG